MPNQLKQTLHYPSIQVKMIHPLRPLTQYAFFDRFSVFLAVRSFFYLLTLVREKINNQGKYIKMTPKPKIPKTHANKTCSV